MRSCLIGGVRFPSPRAVHEKRTRRTRRCAAVSVGRPKECDRSIADRIDRGISERKFRFRVVEIAILSRYRRRETKPIVPTAIAARPRTMIHVILTVPTSRSPRRRRASALVARIHVRPASAATASTLESTSMDSSGARETIVMQSTAIVAKANVR